MIENRKNYSTLRNIVVLLFLSQPAFGQNVDAICQEYKNEQAAFTNVKEQLVIKNENGRLVASSNISKEKILIGELSPGLYNTEYIYHSYFNELKDHDEEALVPGKNGYKRSETAVTKTVPSKDNSIFYDDSKETEITFTGLTAKSLLRTNYTLSHTDLHILPAFYFQENLPVAQSTYEVTAPKYVNIKFVIKGNQADKLKQERKENKNTVTYTFTASSIPAFKDYDDVPSVSWYALHVVPYIASYQLPGDEPVEWLRNPADLYAYLYEFIRKINVKEDKELDQAVASITKGDKTQKEKAAHIYQWVQQNIHYIAFEDSLEGFIPRQAATIYQRRFGDCKDMASILTAMCKTAGIEAHLTWTGTRSKPYSYEETPLPIVNNHMICTIKIDGEWIFLDGTNPLIPFGAIPDNIQGKETMVALDEKNFTILPVPETDSRFNVTTDTTFLKVNDKQASGKSTIDFQGYASWSLQTLMMYNKNDDLDKMIKEINTRGSNKYVQQHYKVSTSDTGNKNCRISADFIIDDYVQKVDKEYYVNMNLNRTLEGHYIDTTGRDVASFFKYKDINRETVLMEIPQGYHVSYLPPAATGSLNDVWSYKIGYSQKGNTVILSKEYTLNSMSILPQYFTQHNAMLDNLNKQYKESVVLTAN